MTRAAIATPTPSKPVAADADKVRIPERLYGDVQIRMDTFKEADRTVEVIWAEGAKVKRYDWREGGYYIEELDMDPGSVRMDRFDGMSLLDAHMPYSMDDRIGTVVKGSARVEGGKGYATVKLSRKQRGEELFQDLIDGHSFPVSVGYRTHAYEKIDGDSDTLPVLRATDWEPMEISAVPIPADPGAASLRSEEARSIVDVAIKRRNGTARTRNLERSFPVDPEEDTIDSPAESRASPSSQPSPFGMRQRRAVVDQFGRDWTVEERSDFLADHSRASETQLRHALVDEIVTRQEQNGQFPHSSHNRNSHDDPANFARAAGEAIFARANPAHQLSDQAREFAHRSVPDLARIALERRGERTAGMSAPQVVTRALHSTSDFPLIVSAVADQSLRAGYKVPESELRQTANATTHENFKLHYNVDLSGAPQLLKVNEHGEYKRGTLKESREGYGLATFGRIIGFTRQLLINDDLGALVNVPQRMGQAARLFEIKSLVALVEENPVMADGNAVFSAGHANDLTPAALSVAALSAARLAMRKQVDPVGELIGVGPKFLVVPSELETVAEQVLTDLAASAVSEVNPFAKRLILIVEPRLANSTQWYVSADPAMVPGLEYSHLAGEPGPQLESRSGWDVDGIEIKVRLDFGAGFLDHRGWVRNAGA